MHLMHVHLSSAANGATVTSMLLAETGVLHAQHHTNTHRPNSYLYVQSTQLSIPSAAAAPQVSSNTCLTHDHTTINIQHLARDVRCCWVEGQEAHQASDLLWLAVAGCNKAITSTQSHHMPMSGFMYGLQSPVQQASTCCCASPVCWVALALGSNQCHPCCCTTQSNDQSCNTLSSVMCQLPCKEFMHSDKQQALPTMCCHWKAGTPSTVSS